MRKTIIHVDMDDVLCHYTKAFKLALEKNPAISYPQSQYGFFSDLEPIEGAIDAMMRLSCLPNTEVYILTAPSYMNPMCYTEKRQWVGKHLGMYFVKRLIICPNKGLVKGDFLIDDNVSGKGQEDFEGIILHFGSNEFPTWKEILANFNY